MTDNLPELRRPASERAVDRPTAPSRRQTRRPGGNALRDLLGRMAAFEGLDPELEAWEIQYAAVGAVAALAAAAVALTLPEPTTIDKDGFDLFGIATQSITVGTGLLEGLVSTARVAMWPLAVLGVAGLILDSFFAVRPRQPIGWHYICVGQMLIGFLAGMTILAIFAIVLVNVVAGLLAAAAFLIVTVVLLGIVAVVLSLFSNS